MHKRSNHRLDHRSRAVIGLVNLVLLCCASVQAQTTSVVSYSGPSISIPDNYPSGVDVYLEVSGLGVLTDLEFRLDSLPGCDASVGNTNASIDHPWIRDVILRLTAPDGAPTIAIVERINVIAKNFCTVLLDDDGGYPSISTFIGSGPVQGNYSPQNPLSAFAGENPNGYWKLNISDNQNADVGTFRRFSLILHTLPVNQITVDLLDDPFPNGCTPGSCSLREAINLANAQPGLDRILLPTSTQLVLTRAGADEDANFTGDLDILDEVEIVGAGPALTVLTQTTNDRLFHGTGAARNLTLRQLKLQGGRGVAVGGAILSGGASLGIEDVELTGNEATSRGGAVFFTGYGGVFAGSGPQTRAVFNRVVFDDNHAVSPSAGPTVGGALSAYSSGYDLSSQPTVTIRNSIFNNNSASSGGGAVALDASQGASNIRAAVRDSRFEHNRVTGPGWGGALGVNVAENGVIAVDIDQSVFIDNRVVGLSANSRGGAIYAVSGGAAAIKRSRFEANFARQGGAVHIGTGEISDTTLCSNSAIDGGGAILSASNPFGPLAIRRSTLCNNTVSTTNTSMPGGGAIAASGGFLTVERSTLVGNTALRGGAIAVGTGDLILNSNTMDAPPQPSGALGSLLRHSGTSNTDVLRFSSNILIGQCSYLTAGIFPDGAFFNIESNANTCRLTQATIAISNQLSVTTAAIGLGPLTNNGGPTDTRLPIAPSIAINNGYTFACTPLDQRGYARGDTSCDVGSVEASGYADRIFSHGFE